MTHDNINAAIADTATVYEAGLAAGTQNQTDLEIVTGNLTINAANGTLIINQDGSYSYASS